MTNFIQMSDNHKLVPRVWIRAVVLSTKHNSTREINYPSHPKPMQNFRQIYGIKLYRHHSFPRRYNNKQQTEGKSPINKTSKQLQYHRRYIAVESVDRSYKTTKQREGERQLSELCSGVWVSDLAEAGFLRS